MVEPLGMPDLRMLKMIELTGRMPVLASSRDKALVWVTPSIRPWVARELAAAGILPLHAASLDHLAASLRANDQPVVALAVVELADDRVVSALSSARWSGYDRPLIAIARSSVAAAVRQLLGIEHVIAPNEPERLTGVASSALARARQ